LWHLLARSLIGAGERVDDIALSIAMRVRLLDSGQINKSDDECPIGRHRRPAVDDGSRNVSTRARVSRAAAHPVWM
jgi:hypothetical protein